MRHTAINQNEINVDAAESFVAHPDYGATLTFVGRVRNNNLGHSIKAINYDCSEKHATMIMNQIIDEALEKYDAAANIFIEHFKGMLSVGGISIIIAVATAHRGQAYDISRYIIEHIKLRLPVWKQEITQSGEEIWQNGNQL